MKTLRYGIAGFGGIALNRIAKEGFRLDRSRFEPADAEDAVELVGVTSRSESRRRAAEGLGLHWYANFEELLDDDSLDAVFVASDNNSHFAQTRRVLESGKHCIVEKPITTSVSDARELARIAGERNLSLGVNHMMVHNAYNRAARELLSSGSIGSPQHIVLHIEFLYGTTPDEAASWRCAQPEQRGGPIGDVGSHCTYMAEYLLGSNIVSVSCTEIPRSLDIAVENGASIRFETQSGLSGEIRVSFAAPRGGLESTLLNFGYEIFGSEALIRSYGTLGQLSGHSDEPVNLRLELERPDKLEQVPPKSVRNIYAEVIRHHAQSIRDGKPMDGAEAIHNLEIVLACYDSLAQNGRTQSVSA